MPLRDSCHSPSEAIRHPEPIGGANVSPSTSRSSSVTSSRSARSIVAAKSSAPPMTQSGAGVPRRGVHDLGALGRPLRVAGHDDVAPAGKRLEAGIERVPGLAAHDDGVAEGQLLEMGEVLGDVPRHPARGADDAVVRLGPDEGEGIIRRRRRGSPGGAGSRRPRSRRACSRRSSPACAVMRRVGSGYGSRESCSVTCSTWLS